MFLKGNNSYMKNFLARITRSISAFMYGRHGQDKLSLHLLYAAIIILLLSSFFLRLPLTILYYVLFFISIYRTFSKNNTKRYAELNKYNAFLNKIKSFFKRQRNRWKERKTHVYFKCKCGAILRVPKGRGEIIVHCPKCKASIDKKT